ncbi:MAG TPA: type VI secretion system tip protein TssI/VgrG [Minicystis sp.]|nr:type VI secretion system tip protein TssI/VgrG [Minicystis sp.]
MVDAALEVTLRIEGEGPLVVARCTVVEGLSQRTRAHVEIATEHHVAFDRALAARATLAIRGPVERAFALRLAGAELLKHEHGSLYYRVELCDVMGLLALRKNTRKFRNERADAIVARVLDEAGIAHAFALTAPVPVRPFCVQYRETDLAFVERLLEQEGIHYAIEDDGTPRFGDATVAADLVRPEPFELVESAGALADAEPGVHEIRRGARTVTGAVTCGDFDWKKPKLVLRATAFGERDTELERYAFPAGYRDPGDGERLARLRVEAERVRARYVRGKSSVAAFRPGRAFAFGGLAGAAFEGEYVLTRVEHVFVSAAFAGPGDGQNGGATRGDATYENRFDGIPRAVPFRPPVKTPRPEVSGTHTAMVRGPAGEEIHTDAFGRFKAQFHWDREATGTDADSGWIRYLQESATSQTLARTGWEVFVGYVDGDPDRPVGLARAMNGVAVPAYAQPAHKNVMTIKTPSSPSTGGYNELKMDDTAGSQAISLRAEKDLDALVKNDKSESIGHDQTHAVGVDLTRQVQGDQTISIGADADETVDGSANLVVEKSRTLRVGAAETVEVGGSHGTATTGSETEKVGSMRLTIAGAIKPPSLASIARSTGMSVLASASPGAAQALATVQQLRGLGAQGGGALSGAASGVASAATTALLSGKGLSGAGQAAEQSLTSLLPSGQSLQGLVPSRSWIPSGAGLQNAVKGAVASAVSVDNVIGMLASGGIERMATAKAFKLVGGAYVTAALLGVDVKVGLAYLETIGGAKLTLAAKAIKQSVDGKLVVTVGGAILRTATALVDLKSQKGTTVTAGLAAAYKTKDALLVKAKTVKITAKQKLVLKSGETEISLEPSAAKLKGKLELSADKDIVMTGNTLDLT